MKQVGKELVKVVVSVKFEGLAEMVGDAELTGGNACPLTAES